MEELTSNQAALGAMAQAITTLDAACAQLSSQELPAGQAAYFAWLAERTAQTLSRLQIHAADAVQRSGSHQLDTESLDAIADAGAAPTDEQLAALHGTCTLGRSSFKDAADLHSGWLGIAHGAALSRLAAAGSLIAKVSEAGERTTPDCPQLAAHFANRNVDPRPAIGAARAIRNAEADLPGPQARAQLEAQAVKLIAQEPASAAKHLSGLITEQLQAQRPPEALFAEAGLFPRGTKGGLVIYQLKVFPHDAELIESLRAKIDNPNTIAGNREQLNELVHASYPNHAEPAASDEPAPSVEPGTPVAPTPTTPKEWDDAPSMPGWARAPAAEATEAEPPKPPSNLAPPPERPFEDLSPALRHLTGLLAVLRANRVGGKNPGAGLIAPQVIVHLNYEKMLAGAASFASTENGLPLTAAEARTLMCNAGIYPAVLDGKGQPLDIGRSKRLFPPHMKRALAARDRGCLYPGCRMPASRCEADHVDPWEEGGQTRVDRGVLLCPMHHHARHAGLFNLVVAEGKPPAVLLPKFLDPDQQPRRNTYWFSAAEVLAA
ncbi:HNH endonuclease [Arthrobacter sp. MYb224]|uniref:HNH endonuclease signature motif containing protein n=1 Tax=Arthrobacter sp. MYb224 TaxID=1848600 RepID=UPI000CFB3A92|nr:HNH endonuclease signature motif containing protein [Arthrobacter sp. MYb224]PQZ96662.1 HNH endonuclease [Arthrobacter sp. MYb224]